MDKLDELNEKLANCTDDAERSQLQKEAKSLSDAPPTTVTTAVRRRGECGSVKDFSEVEIAEDGIFKYVQIQVSDPTGECRVLIRGNTEATYHYQCAKCTCEKLRAAGLDYEVVGGGRIQRVASERTIHIFGFSYQYGPADHSITADLFEKTFEGERVTHSADGY